MTAKPRGHVYDNILETIGGTPLVRLPNLTKKYDIQTDILLKLEFFNPLSSVKDRIGLAMFEAAEESGKISAGQTTIIEPTSGNTGIALAFIAAAKGYRIILTMPESMSVERRKMLRLMGAELVLTKAEDGMKGAIAKAQELAVEIDNSFIPGQFDNPANPDIHARTTALEIWEDTKGKADILVAGVGTGGTITGVSRILKEKKEGFESVAVEPEDSPVLSGGEAGPHKIQGIGAGFVPAILETNYIDQIIKISNDDAFAMARELAAEEGIPGGISTGANVKAAIEIASMKENKGKTIVTIGCSSADRYLSTALFEDLAE